MRVTEVFYSLQGEGARVGSPSVFVRLSGCSMKEACLRSGVLCDTEFESGLDRSREDLLSTIRSLSLACEWIIWTGGEPTDQLTEEDVTFFRSHGYRQAIETSGVRPVAPGLDWITVSPKVSEHVLLRHFPTGVSELRYVRHAGQPIPCPQIRADHFFLSPHSDGDRINRQNLEACIALCLANPPWRLSLQAHKVWTVR